MTSNVEYTTILTLAKHLGLPRRALSILSHLKMEPLPLTRDTQGVPQLDYDTCLKLAGAVAAADDPDLKRAFLQPWDEWLREIGTVALAANPNLLERQSDF